MGEYEALLGENAVTDPTTQNRAPPHKSYFQFHKSLLRWQCGKFQNIVHS